MTGGLRKLPTDVQWRNTIKALDSAVGYLADPDTLNLLAAARAVKQRDAIDWLSAQGAKARRGPAGMDVPPGSPGRQSTQTSDVSDPTGRAATQGRPDPDAELWAVLLVVDRASAVIINARSRLSRLAYRRGDAEARDRALGAAAKERTGQGTCMACGDWCSGAEKDRLRGGFDDKCRKRWVRAGSPDRGQFVAQVQAELAARADAAAESEDGRADGRSLRLIQGGAEPDTTVWDPSRHLGADQYERQLGEAS